MKACTGHMLVKFPLTYSSAVLTWENCLRHPLDSRLDSPDPKFWTFSNHFTKSPTPNRVINTQPTRYNSACFLLPVIYLNSSDLFNSSFFRQLPTVGTVSRDTWNWRKSTWHCRTESEHIAMCWKREDELVRKLQQFNQHARLVHCVTYVVFFLSIFGRDRFGFITQRSE
jgi:hypothetical protein